MPEFTGGPFPWRTIWTPKVSQTESALAWPVHCWSCSDVCNFTANVSSVQVPDVVYNTIRSHGIDGSAALLVSDQDLDDLMLNTACKLKLRRVCRLLRGTLTPAGRQIIDSQVVKESWRRSKLPVPDFRVPSSRNSDTLSKLTEFHAQRKTARPVINVKRSTGNVNRGRTTFPNTHFPKAALAPVPAPAVSGSTLSVEPSL